MPPIVGVERSTRTNRQAGTSRERVISCNYASHRGLKRLIGNFVSKETFFVFFDVRIGHGLCPTVDGCPNPQPSFRNRIARAIAHVTRVTKLAFGIALQLDSPEKLHRPPFQREVRPQNKRAALFWKQCTLDLRLLLPVRNQRNRGRFGLSSIVLSLRKISQHRLL